MPKTLSPARRELVSIVEERGRITFAEFMERVLYDPHWGYYTRLEKMGRWADYYTSPSAHPVFGALIATQLQRMWVLLGRPDRFTVVEVGAGNGILANDVLAYIETSMKDFRDSVQYVTVDRSHVPQTIDFVQHIITDGLPLRGVEGCIISNELLDAFPVNRFQVNSGQALEVYVSFDGTNFIEVLDKPSTPLIANYVDRIGENIPEGYCGEVNLNLAPWIEEVASGLDRGFVLTIDYGYARTEPDSYECSRGTVQAYHNHANVTDLYNHIGEQDITAHVDFTDVIEKGEQVGLTPIKICTQSRFLREAGLTEWLSQISRTSMPETTRMANIMAIRDLVKPDGLGYFKVLLQEKNTGVNEIPRENEPAPSQPPLLDTHHIPLMMARYPHLGWQPEEVV